MTTPPPRSFLIDQAATRLGVTRRTIYKWIKAGRLQTFHTTPITQRVTHDSVEAVERQRQQERA